MPIAPPQVATPPVSSPPTPAPPVTTAAAYMPPSMQAARQRAEAIRGAIALPAMTPPAAARPVDTRAGTTPAVAPQPFAALSSAFQTGVAQLQTNRLAQHVVVRRDNQNGRNGSGRARQQTRRAQPGTNTYDEHDSPERDKFVQTDRAIISNFSYVLDRRLRMGTRVATPHTLAIDRMYYALLYLVGSETRGASREDVQEAVDALYNTDDRTIYDRYQAEIGRHAQQPIEGVDESAF
ncbi:hypothetical protein GGI18_001758 [Coemansia linderi]|uniref:Uncharacterized protein n=1 Tax=Coemansia linderi TaxID=2663919 RepID=A0ACC1KJ69_9FUNG|nr:hypothetical protein GGI18_001758 [Coemansia linderi]